MKVLLVLTSHDKLGDTGRKTGFWLEELAAPYYEFKDAGAQITLARPRAVVRRSIPRARIRASRRTSPVASKRTRTRMGWTGRAPAPNGSQSAWGACQQLNCICCPSQGVHRSITDWRANVRGSSRCEIH